MSYPSIALVVLAVWGTTGIVLGLVMGRRGYSGFGWFVVGTILGPVAVPLALLGRATSRPDTTMKAGLAGSGPIDVLVGIDGSDAAVDAAMAVAGILGARIGTFTLAAVAPLDATPEEERLGEESVEAARRTLATALQPIGVRPAAIVLHGQPADTLRRHAVDDGYDVLAVGPRGRGASKAVLGSVASTLVRSAPVPVLVAGEAEARRLVLTS